MYNVPVNGVKRRYHAPVRQEQAAQTRRRIAEAAALEFAEHGWAGTTLAAVAARAGVTPQSVHLAIGGKAALLVRAVEITVAGASDEQQLSARPAFADVYAPRMSRLGRLRAFSAAAAAIYERAAGLFVVLQQAAAGDPAAAELASRAGHRRLSDHQRLAALLVPTASRQAQQQLADSIWALAAPSVYIDLVQRRNWTPDQYRGWLTDQLRSTIRRAVR